MMSRNEKMEGAFSSRSAYGDRTVHVLSMHLFGMSRRCDG